MCGFIGVFGPTGAHVAPEVLRGLLAVQHRGQDAAGLVTFEQKFHAKKGLGLVRDVFQEKHLGRLRGNLAVGHVRYPTVGHRAEADVQPFWLDFPMGVAMAHNGNVTNYLELRGRYFAERGFQLASDCDLEAILYVFASALMLRSGPVTADHVFGAVREVFERVKGAYSVVGIIPRHGLFAFRDPHGIKPIVLGERSEGGGGGAGKSVAVASESVVLDVNGYESRRDLAPGEAIFVDRDHVVHAERLSELEHRPCIFELVYFARPDSCLDRISVHKARLRMGEALARRWAQSGLRADVIIPVPESARTAALAMAQALSLPYREGLVKNRYVGRTFIMPSDSERRDSISVKLNPIPLEFKGKDVLLVDDSIVRGNTSRQLVRMARSAGADKVYLASCSPPLRFPCPYGIDMSTKREFIARGRSETEVAREIGCDGLVYQTLADLEQAGLRGNPRIDRFCTACFDGDYPTPDLTEAQLAAIESERTGACEG
jgi:amidophosphoribosyltransferase